MTPELVVRADDRMGGHGWPGAGLCSGHAQSDPAAPGGQAAHPGRGAANRGQHRQAAGAIAAKVDAEHGRRDANKNIVP
jgi:hypothetical protein